MAEHYKLTYFNLRALGESIRFIFAYAGVEFEDNRIEPADWPPLKENYTWGQLPILQVGDRTLCQSNAIGRYLAKKYDLMGEDDWVSAKMDEFADAIGEYRGAWRLYYFEQDEERKAQLKTDFVDIVAPKYLSKFEMQIDNSGGPFMFGKKLSWIDFKMANVLEFFEIQAGIALDIYPNLKNLKETVFEIPQIKTWIQKRPHTPM